MIDTQAITVRLPKPLYEHIRKTAFDQHVSMNALLAHAIVWQIWNQLPDSEPSPVKRIAHDLGMEPADVAHVIYPPGQFGAWYDSQEPEL